MVLNIKSIAIVAYSREIRKVGAEALQEYFPSAKVSEYFSEKDIMSSLKNSCPSDIDLIFTDMSMEESLSGYYVALESWAWNIPCIPVFEMLKPHATEDHAQVYIAGFQEPIYGTKKNKNTWLEIIRIVMEKEYKKNTILKTLDSPKNTTPNYDRGKIVAFFLCDNIIELSG